MLTKRKLLLVLLVMKAFIAFCQSEKRVGGSCEGCEAALEYNDRKLIAVDTLPDFKEKGPRMLVSGTIFRKDGKTPAKNVILYIYHTDQKGIYPTKGNEQGWDKRHGYLRGWIKTDGVGRYKFYTLKPAPYPERNIPAHIHITVKEEGYSPYYIDEFLFDDDPLVTESVRKNQEKRGGSGIVKVTSTSAGLMLAHRDIILGLNVPGY